MARNVEIKARVEDLEAVRQAVESLTDSAPTVLRQVDTFYHCRHGRLKLREIHGHSAELISYIRADATGPKPSEYTCVPVANPRLLHEALSSSLGTRGAVKKVRTLYLIGQTRAHLDVVEGLGQYIELEVMLADDQPVSEGEQTARKLLRQLDISEAQLVKGAYIDLLG